MWETIADGVVKGSPACHRAVLESVEALRKAGHECVEIGAPDGAYTLTITIGGCRVSGFSRTGVAIVHCNHFCRWVQKADRAPRS